MGGGRVLYGLVRYMFLSHRCPYDSDINNVVNMVSQTGFSLFSIIVNILYAIVFYVSK